MENLTCKLDVRLTTAERDAIDALAVRHGRSRGAELRAALDAWLEFNRPAEWLDAEAERR